MKIGFANKIITPSLTRPVYLAGFGLDRQAETVHDDLYVSTLTLQSGPTSLVLCALDLIGFFRRDVLEVIHRVHEEVPQAQILIASTHTHHGPDTMGLWGPDMKTCGVDNDYMANIKTAIAETILEALANPQPAICKITSVQAPGLVKNARDAGILDDELTVLQLLTPEGHPLASLFNFPCHPEVLWEHNTHITADYVGYLRDEVKNLTGAPCIFFSGALGGMLTPDVQDHSFEEAEHMGKQLAHLGLEALEKAQIDPKAHISLQKVELDIRLTNILYKIAFRRKLLPDIRVKGHITTEVNLIKIGGLWMATVPGEMLPKLGLSIKASLKNAGAAIAGVIGLANDELGYILPAEDFKYPLNPFRPGSHYEETNAVSKEIGPEVVRAIHSLL